ncbi:MAG TPA: metal ABC transporter permease [Acidimicrobiaceae bacterium]|nr:metal ABC transporter permease [Acidimicrobiaceae bacterium]
MTLDELLRPFEFQFFQNGLVVATVAGALCGLIGVYVVLRSMSYIGHGLSHAIFGGFAVSALAGVNVFLGAGLWGLASALAVSSVTRRRPIGSDAAIGVITTASFAFGLAVLQLGGGADVDADAALFGNVLGVTRGDVWIVSGVTLFAIAVIVLRYRSLLFVTFDPEVAEASGVKVARIDALLMLVLAASILATMNVMGVTLIAAALVVPAVVARMVTSSFSTMLWLSTLIGAVCGFVGMNLSYHLDVASGPTIVLVGGALFVAALAATGVRGRTRLAGVDAH